MSRKGDGHVTSKHMFLSLTCTPYRNRQLSALRLSSKNNSSFLKNFNAKICVLACQTQICFHQNLPNYFFMEKLVIKLGQD